MNPGELLDAATVQRLYAILALAAIVGMASLAVVRIAALVSAGAAGLYGRVAGAIARWALWAAWVVAVLATAGSLYFSEVAMFEPCRLCWYQRIAMYPLVVLLAIAAWRRDAIGARIYGGALAVIGALVAGYHVLLEWFPTIESGTCSIDVPCSVVWFREFGFISLPTLALTAFLLILTLLATTHRASRSAEDEGGLR